MPYIHLDTTLNRKWLSLTTLILILLSAAIGASIGLSGIGGFLIVPMMLTVIGASVPQAILTALVANLGAMVANGLLAVRNKHVGWRTFWFMAFGSAVGALASGWLITALPPFITRYLIAIFLAGLGLSVLIKRWPARTEQPPIPKRGSMMLLGAFAQLSAVLVGIGGPAITVPVLSARHGGTQKVVGTALLHGVVVSSLGILVTRQAGASVDWYVALVPSVVILSSLCVSLFRPRIISMINIKPLVGVLAIVGAIVIILSR